MPKIGMEPIRRAALVKATIEEIGETGSLEVTVSRIARRAGVSSGLAHHYFGGKQDLLLAAMRHILTQYGAAVRAGLVGAEGPRARIAVIVDASFGPEHFEADVVAAWMSFYVHAQSAPGARRLLTVYQARLRSNLTDAARPVLGGGAEALAATLAATIDGLYLRHALGGRPGSPDGAAAAARCMALADLFLEAT